MLRDTDFTAEVFGFQRIFNRLQQVRRLFSDCLLCQHSLSDGWHSDIGLVCRVCASDMRRYPPGTDILLHYPKLVDNIRCDYLDGLTVVSQYEWPVRAWTVQLKFHQYTHLALPLANLIEQQLTALHWPVPDLMCALPLHSSRQRKRGYNQSELLLKQLSEFKQIPRLTNLKRTKSTQPQSSLGRHERKKNLLGAFTCLDSICGKSVLLIDDVVTTGATLNEAAKSLKDAGAAAVYAAAVALRTLD